MLKQAGEALKITVKSFIKEEKLNSFSLTKMGQT